MVVFPHLESILYLIVILAAASSLVLITMIFRTRAEKARNQLKEKEAVHEILDRIGGGAEMSAFLNSEGGQKFLRNFGPQRASDSSRESALRIMTVGIILVCFGIGTILPSIYYRIPDFASVVTLIGVGMVAASSTTMWLRGRWAEEELARQAVTPPQDATSPPSQESPDSPHGLS